MKQSLISQEIQWNVYWRMQGFVLNQTVEKLNFSHEVAAIAICINMQECSSEPNRDQTDSRLRCRFYLLLETSQMLYLFLATVPISEFLFMKK